MSQTRSDQGQSMEEILASIRRIIAEGERDLPGVDPKRPGINEPGPAVDTRPPWSRPEPSPPSDMPADILVLTEMVQEDGTVVSLESESSAIEPAMEKPEIGVAEPLEQSAAAEPARADEPVTDEAAPIAMASVDNSSDDVLRSIAAGLAIEQGAAAGPLAEPAKPVEALSATVPVIAPVEQPVAEAEQVLMPAMPPAAPPQEMEKGPVSGEGLKKPELVSEETLAASTAALSQLAHSVGRTRDATAGPSPTVEELVRSAVEPLLKQWLDANLSRIVERMVREAIDRVVRRVE
jgi:cell pole-organizing protein PopZ